MTRNEVLELIRSHLAEELEVDPSRIQDDTRFKEDLEADSLDLVALVQELEDRSGVRIPDEEAVKIKSVGEAADYVASRPESEAPTWRASWACPTSCVSTPARADALPTSSSTRIACLRQCARR